MYLVVCQLDLDKAANQLGEAGQLHQLGAQLLGRLTASEEKEVMQYVYELLRPSEYSTVLYSPFSL